MSLSIRSFGLTQVLVDGVPVVWHAESARNLFFYLLANPEGGHRNTILDRLWQQDPSTSVANRFRVTVHRIRVALHDPNAILEDHGRYRLHPNTLRQSDIHAFYTALQRAERSLSPQQKLFEYQRALGLYLGEFMAGESADWVLSTREELRAAYVRAEVELSLLHCEHGGCEASVEALSRALRADPFVGENYHQKLMTCLSVVEDKYAAIEHYRRFLAFLRDELEDTPMAETQAYAERIKRGEVICRRRLGLGTDGPTQSCPLSASTRPAKPYADLIQLQ